MKTNQEKIMELDAEMKRLMKLEREKVVEKYSSIVGQYFHPTDCTWAKVTKVVNVGHQEIFCQGIYVESNSDSHNGYSHYIGSDSRFDLEISEVDKIRITKEEFDKAFNATAEVIKLNGGVDSESPMKTLKDDLAFLKEMKGYAKKAADDVTSEEMLLTMINDWIQEITRRIDGNNNQS